MGWTVEIDASAEKQLAKIDRNDALRIRKFLRERLLDADNPRQTGKALVGSKYKNLWRYRVGDYRIICNLQDNRRWFSSSKSDILVKFTGKALAAA